MMEAAPRRRLAQANVPRSRSKAPMPTARLSLAFLLVALCAAPAFAAPGAGHARKPAQATAPAPVAAQPANHDHDLDYYEDNSKDPDTLLRIYAHNSHLQKLLDLGLYQMVFDDDPAGVEAFLAAGAKLKGLGAVPLSPMRFATWRHETRTIQTLAAHGAPPEEETTDQDQLVRQTVDTVMNVAELVKQEMKAAEAEYRRQAAWR